MFSHIWTVRRMWAGLWSAASQVDVLIRDFQRQSWIPMTAMDRTAKGISRGRKAKNKNKNNTKKLTEKPFTHRAELVFPQDSLCGLDLSVSNPASLERNWTETTGRID